MSINTAGIPMGKLSPAYLNSNSTSHTLALSAFAELIDNAYDPDVNAKKLHIDKRQIDGVTCLTFVDDGNGMDPETLHNMMSFGFSDKDKFETPRHKAVGRYGNGFKSGSMRLGKDAIVFTRRLDTMSVGLLSQTFLKNTNAEVILVPIITWNLPEKTKHPDPSMAASLAAILQHSIFKNEDDLLKELAAIEKTGTTIMIYNLKSRSDGLLELDFESDPFDIRDPETHLKEEAATVALHQKSRHMVSLKEYCKILYLKPKLRIWIRGKNVKTLLIRKYLTRSHEEKYKPTTIPRAIKITFGFAAKRLDDYGLMLYHTNRLITAYQKIGCQTKSDIGQGVIAVAEANHLRLKHTKQEFEEDAAYSTLLQNISKKLKEYWNIKTETTDDMVEEQDSDDAFFNWIQCDNCNKWRKMIRAVQVKDSEKWYCRLNEDPQHNRCEIGEEDETEENDKEESRKYKESKNKLRLKLATLRQQSRQSFTDNNTGNQVTEERIHPPESVPESEEQTLIEPIRQSVGNQAHEENIHSPTNKLESDRQMPGTENQPHLRNITRKRNANKNVRVSPQVKDMMDLSPVATSFASSDQEASTSEIDPPPKRQRTSSKSKLFGEPQKKNIMPLDAGTQTIEVIRMCNRECMTNGEELYRRIENEKKRAVFAERKLETYVTQNASADANLKEAKKQMEEATKMMEDYRKMNASKTKVDEELHRKMQNEVRRADDAERKLKEVALNARKLDLADRKAKDADKKMEEADKMMLEVNRKMREADGKLEEANKKEQESLKNVEHKERKKVLAINKFQEELARANRLERRLGEFRRNVYTFMQRNTNGDIGTEDDVEHLLTAIIHDDQPH
ncbi:MORC family CW-type zinc finger protein 3-like isoform X2 [Pecten maximus]|nr:MORC family CW-type zinc finger protein 3-like isoform X2 [Pecten maximus]XP_033741289.1 MORC family CW-type zinc finger protein 3-like isoform X2 [Pecten maximus]